MGYLDERLQIKRIELKKFIFAQHQIIDEGVDYDYAKKVSRYQLKVYILGENLKKYSRHIEYPDGWWQAFKARWFPLWLLQRFPIRKKIFNLDIDVVALYPELSAKTSLPKECPVLILQKYEQEGVRQSPYVTV